MMRPPQTHPSRLAAHGKSNPRGFRLVTPRENVALRWNRRGREPSTYRFRPMPPKPPLAGRKPVYQVGGPSLRTWAISVDRGLNGTALQPRWPCNRGVRDMERE